MDMPDKLEDANRKNVPGIARTSFWTHIVTLLFVVLLVIWIPVQLWHFADRDTTWLASFLVPGLPVLLIVFLFARHSRGVHRHGIETRAIRARSSMHVDLPTDGTEVLGALTADPMAARKQVLGRPAVFDGYLALPDDVRPKVRRTVVLTIMSLTLAVATSVLFFSASAPEYINAFVLLIGALLSVAVYAYLWFVARS